MATDNKELMEKLHEPLDKGIELASVLPDHLYFKRLTKLFGYHWQSKIEREDHFGMGYWRCTLTIKRPDDILVTRSGMKPVNKTPLAAACEMLGIGSSARSGVLFCVRKLNEEFGFDWKYEITWVDKHALLSNNPPCHCSITVAFSNGDSVIRTAVGETEEDAFVLACEMFGIDGTRIPF